MFKRWINNEILSIISSGRSLLLLGSRRAGKTTLAKMINPSSDSYLTMDDIDIRDEFKKDPKLISNYIKKDGLLIIDEVQKSPFLFDTIKFYIDQGFQFLLTGSSSLSLMQNTVETLAGRIRIRECPTTVVGESSTFPFLHFLNNFHPKILQNINLTDIRSGNREVNEAILFGGYPEIVTADHKEKKPLLKDYKNTYLMRDIHEMGNIKDFDGFRALLLAIARSISSTSDYNNFAQNTNLSFQTTKKYLFSMEQSFLLFKVYPYYKSMAKRFLKSPKWYFADSGLLNSFNHGLSEGALFENFVISEFRKRLAIMGLETENMFYSKTQSGAEVDLILDIDKTKLAFEIKTSTVFSRTDYKNLKELMAVDKSISQSFLVYRGDMIEEVDKNIFTLPVGALFGRV